MLQRPVHVDLVVQSAQGLHQFGVLTVLVGQVLDQIPQGVAAPAQRSHTEGFAVLGFKLAQGERFLARFLQRGALAPVDMFQEHLRICALFHQRGAVLQLNQVLQSGGRKFQETVLGGLETGGGNEGQSELQKLLPLHSVRHDAKTGGQGMEIPVDTVDAAHQFFQSCGHNTVHQRFQLVTGQLEVQFRDLVVHDENGLVRIRRAGLLQREQRVQLNVVPIR